MSPQLDPESARLVRLVLSRFVGEMRGQRAFTYSLGHLAAAFMEERLPVVPAGYQALKRLGMKPREVSDRWALARSRGRVLPDDILSEFIPEAYWPGVSAMIVAGPHATWDRIEAILLAWARGLNEDGSERQVWQRTKTSEVVRAVRGRALSEGTIDIALTAANMLSWHIVELHKLASAGLIEGAQALERWNEAQIPKRRRAADLGAVPANADRSAPPLLLIRRVLRGLDAEVKRRSGTARGVEHSFGCLRDRAFLGVMVAIGGRRGSIVSLKRGDYIRDHTFPDGTTGPAVVITLGEGVKGRGLRRVKGLPDEVARWIDEYLTHLKIGDDELDAPLWYPNLRKKIEAREVWDPAGVDRHLPTVIRRYDEKERLYSAHTLRHLAAQLAEFYGNEWLLEHREQLLFKTESGMPSSAVTFADILLDHDLSSVADVYRGLNNERSREEWSRVAALGSWTYLWGDRGARQGPDRERRRSAALHVREATERLGALETRVRELVADKQLRRDTAIATSSEASPADLFVAMLELDSLSDEIIRVSELVAEARSKLAAAQRAQVDAQAARVPVPDEMPDDEVWREEGEIESVPVEPEREPVRDWCTIAEFRAAFGEGLMPESTLYRWLQGRLPHPDGDRRNMFRLDATGVPTALVVLSERKRRILLDELYWPAIHEDVRERLNALRYFMPPSPWARKRRQVVA